MTINVYSRIKLYNNPEVAPGVCVVCRSTGDGVRKFIDFTFHIDYYGRVYFCTECIREVMDAMDLVPEDSYDKALEVNQDLKNQLKDLRLKETVYKNAISQLASGHHFESVSIDDFVDTVVSAIQESGNSDSNNSGATEEPEGIDSGSDVKGLHDIFGFEKSGSDS